MASRLFRAANVGGVDVRSVTDGVGVLVLWWRRVQHGQAVQQFVRLGQKLNKHLLLL